MDLVLTELSQVIEAGPGRAGNRGWHLYGSRVETRSLRSLLRVPIAGAHVSAMRTSRKKTYARALFPTILSHQKRAIPRPLSLDAPQKTPEHAAMNPVPPLHHKLSMYH